MINPSAELPASRWPAAFGVIWTAGFLFSVLGLRFGGGLGETDGFVEDAEWIADSLEAAQGVLAGLCILLATLSFATAIHRELKLAHACFSPLWQIEKPSNQKKPKVELKVLPVTESIVPFGHKLSSLLAVLTRSLILTVLVVLLIPTVAVVLATVPAWKQAVNRLTATLLQVPMAHLDDLKPLVFSTWEHLKNEVLYRSHQTRLFLSSLLTDVVTKSTADPTAMDDAVDALRVLSRTAAQMIVKPFELWGAPMIPYVKNLVRFVFHYLCWQGGWLLPMRPYSMALGITVTNLSSAIAGSIYSSFEYMPASVFVAMMLASVIVSPFILWFLTPVVKQFQRCFSVPWIALAMAVGICIHVSCYFVVSLLRDSAHFMQTSLVTWGPEWLSLTMYNDEDDFLTYRRCGGGSSLSSKTTLLVGSMKGIQTFVDIWVFALFAIAARIRSRPISKPFLAPPKPALLEVETRTELPPKRPLTSSDVDDSSRMSQVVEDDDEADEESAQENFNFRHTNLMRDRRLERTITSSELLSNDEDDDEESEAVSNLTAVSKVAHPSQRSPVHSQTSEPYGSRMGVQSSMAAFRGGRITMPIDSRVHSPAVSGASAAAYQQLSTKSDERTSSEPASDLINNVVPPSGSPDADTRRLDTDIGSLDSGPLISRPYVGGPLNSGPQSESAGCADALAVSYSLGRAEQKSKELKATKIPRNSLNLENKENMFRAANMVNRMSRKTQG